MIKLTREQAKRNYDRACQMQPNFQVGDKVLLCHDFITSTMLLKKLDAKFLVPFQITAKLLELVY